MKYWSIFFLVGLIFSCGEEVKSSVSKNEEPSIYDTFNLPLDTAAIIEMMAIPLSAHHDTLLTPHKLDTFDLIYMQYACDCQQWVEYQEYIRSEDTSNTSYYHLDTDQYGFFIKPAFHDIKINDNIFKSRNRVKFVGYWEEDPDYYTQSEIPVYKKVLTYFGYEIVRPFTVYGPLYHTRETQIPSDPEELILRSEIYFR